MMGCNNYYLPKVIQRRTTGKWLMGAQGSLMYREHMLAHQIWSYRKATDQSAMLHPFTAESTYNGQVNCIRTPGLWSSVTRWPRLMNHNVGDWVSMHGLPGVMMPPGILWDKGKWSQAVWCTGQCSVGMLWVLELMWMLLQNKYTPHSSGYSTCSGLFQHHNAPNHSAKIVQEWFEKHDNFSRCLP